MYIPLLWFVGCYRTGWFSIDCFNWIFRLGYLLLIQWMKSSQRFTCSAEMLRNPRGMHLSPLKTPHTFWDYLNQTSFKTKMLEF